MWIFLKNGFFSIVADRDEPRNLLVRSRFLGDIERVFHVCSVETPTADYRYRVSVKREEVLAALSFQTATMEYGNFKNSVEDKTRLPAYHDVWGTMAMEQGRRHPRSRKKK